MGFAVMRISFIFQPARDIDRMADGREDRELMTAFVTKYLVSLDARHNLVSPRMPNCDLGRWLS